MERALREGSIRTRSGLRERGLTGPPWSHGEGWVKRPTRVWRSLNFDHRPESKGGAVEKFLSSFSETFSIEKAVVEIKQLFFLLTICSGPWIITRIQALLQSVKPF